MLRRDSLCLMFGVFAGLIHLALSFGLGALLPGYDPIHQTISEIGERGSPFEATFKALSFIGTICLIVFSYGVCRFSLKRHLSPIPALFLGFYGLMELGVAIFESPHPLHNVFGISTTVGFFAPMALALAWPRGPDYRVLRQVSVAAAVLLIIGIVLNLMPLFSQPAYLLEHYGLVQRAHFVLFYLWCAYLAVTLLLRLRPRALSGAVADLGSR